MTYVGRLIKDKGIEVLINAFEIVSKNNNNLKLLIAGKIDYLNPSAITEEYLNNKLKLNKNIIWLGEVLDIKQLWRRSHIAVLASRREGLPKSLLEAAASGKAIIATDVPGCREIAINKVNAITFPLDDEEKLVEAIKILSENDTTNSRTNVFFGQKNPEHSTTNVFLGGLRLTGPSRPGRCRKMAVRNSPRVAPGPKIIRNLSLSKYFGSSCHPPWVYDDSH